MVGKWIISGAIKINRILTDAEVHKINKAAGQADLPRAKPLKLSTQRAEMNRWSYENRNFQNVRGLQSQKANDARFKELAENFDRARTALGEQGKSLADWEAVAFPAMPQPHVLQMLGLPNQWLAWHGDILAKVSSKHKLGIPGDELNQLMRAAVLVFKNKNGEFEMVADKRVGDGHLMVALKPDQEERFGLKPEQKLKMTFVKSANGLTWDDMKNQDGNPVVGLENRLKGVGGRTVVYADHVKLRSLLDESSAKSDSSNPLRTNYRVAQIESGLTGRRLYRRLSGRSNYRRISISRDSSATLCASWTPSGRGSSHVLETAPAHPRVYGCALGGLR